jgi:hypothetical protein
MSSSTLEKARKKLLKLVAKHLPGSGVRISLLPRSASSKV